MNDSKTSQISVSTQLSRVHIKHNVLLFFFFSFVVVAVVFFFFSVSNANAFLHARRVHIEWSTHNGHETRCESLISWNFIILFHTHRLYATNWVILLELLVYLQLFLDIMYGCVCVCVCVRERFFLLLSYSYFFCYVFFLLLIHLLLSFLFKNFFQSNAHQMQSSLQCYLNSNN